MGIVTTNKVEEYQYLACEPLGLDLRSWFALKCEEVRGITRIYAFDVFYSESSTVRLAVCITGCLLVCYIS